MKDIAGRPNCFFSNSKVADLVFIMNGIFSGEKLPSQAAKIYTEDFINNIKSKYRFSSEIVMSLPEYKYSMLEFLLLNREFNDLENFKNKVMALDDTDFFYYFLGNFVDRELICLALKNSEGLNKLYERYENLKISYLALKSLFTSKDLFLKEYFDCLEELDNDNFSTEYGRIADEIYSGYDSVEKALISAEPLEFSQSIMGKNFKNRGPYEKFFFIPSCFINIKAVRFFYEDQILVYSTNYREFTKKDIKNLLKVLSDETRFEIIELLSENKAMMGKELAVALKLTTPTISHHIEQLKEAGFINEERVKNSKYYSINSNALKKLTDFFTDKYEKLK
jgi:DNA-binding transcriptional ArsR family regulator